MFRKKWFRVLLMHRFYIALALVLQVLFTVAVIWGTGQTAGVRYVLFALSLFASLGIVRRRSKSAYKLSWIFFILLFPFGGGVLYFLLVRPSHDHRYLARMQNVNAQYKTAYETAQGVCKDATQRVGGYVAPFRYLKACAGFPAYMQTKTAYLSPGEAYFDALLKDVRGAKHYVFLEYFIVQEGQMWNSILDVLFEKVRQGVEVRVIYDDMGCFFLLPKDYKAFLEKNGIRTCVFNPFRPLLSSLQNNRDHRKIAVIDGNIAFTGGINLADEYINAVPKHGHWKDAGVRIEGAAVWSFAVMFLQMWSFCTGEDIRFEDYRPKDQVPDEDGIVLPYADNPADGENVCEHVYLQMIAHAERYVYINTPYLIIDDSMVSALCLAAKSGVEVKIITPHMPDKRWVHFTTRSYYRELLEAGVQIYEYTDGFIHAKTMVCDGIVASIGTANLDFRSLYLQFECGVWLYESAAVRELAADFKTTLRRCRKIEPEDCTCAPILKLFEDICRLFAPLM